MASECRFNFSFIALNIQKWRIWRQKTETIVVGKLFAAGLWAAALSTMKIGTVIGVLCKKWLTLPPSLNSWCTSSNGKCYCKICPKLHEPLLYPLLESKDPSFVDIDKLCTMNMVQTWRCSFIELRSAGASSSFLVVINKPSNIKGCPAHFWCTWKT